MNCVCNFELLVIIENFVQDDIFSMECIDDDTVQYFFILFLDANDTVFYVPQNTSNKNYCHRRKTQEDKDSVGNFESTHKSTRSSITLDQTATKDMVPLFVESMASV
jgi:hypothetical protein